MKSSRPRHHRLLQGFALIEVITAASLVGVVALGSVQALGILNRNAATNRIVTNARTILQRDINTALTTTYSTNGTLPAILAITPAAGTAYDDDGGDPSYVVVVSQGATNYALVKSTLTRTVTAVTNPDNADIRKITFSISYQYRGRTYTDSMTTYRTVDD